MSIRGRALLPLLQTAVSLFNGGSGFQIFRALPSLAPRFRRKSSELAQVFALGRLPRGIAMAPRSCAIHRTGLFIWISVSPELPAGTFSSSDVRGVWPMAGHYFLFARAGLKAP